MSKIKKFIKLIIPPIFLKSENLKTTENIGLSERTEYLNNGQIPWSKGYSEHKILNITNSINNIDFLNNLKVKNIPDNYGYRLDERVIEYPWILSKISSDKLKILDAGSTFNFDFIVNHPILENKDLTIFTFAPEENNFCNKNISYVYGDLRNMIFKDNAFDIIVSQSTIEHIDMDNSMYGYDLNFNEDTTSKSYEYIIAVKEMVRVLKNKGTLLLTFPFGKFENHGFFQQFDDEMLTRILGFFDIIGTYELDFFQYINNTWKFATKEELRNIVSYNPHTGKGKLEDGAAHCRSVVCVYFTKN